MSETKSLQGAAASRYRLIGVLVCFLFGIAYILNVHPNGDGLWFWYAVRIRQGSRLYSDMHLSLQPLYVLLTAAFQGLFGLSWLASKILPALQMTAYCALLYLITGYVRWPDWARGIVLVTVYMVTISGPFYRFDDYHITSDVLGAFCIYLLLRLHERSGLSALLTHATLIGLACGLCTGNRLNDGATLFAGSAIALVLIVRRQRWLALLLICAGTAIGLLVVVVLTRDSLHQWAVESILRASRIKGGTGNILLFPFSLPIRLLQAYGQENLRPGAEWFLAILACTAVTRRFWPIRQTRGAKWALSVTFGIALIVVFAERVTVRHGAPVQFFGNIASLALLAGACCVVARILLMLAGKAPAEWSPRESLLLIPAGQLAAGAMTSAIVLPNLTPPVAVALLVLPLVLPDAVGRRVVWMVSTICIAVLLPMVPLKVHHPYFWHHYTDGPMFANRQWYDHPVYGEMYLEKNQLAQMATICGMIKQSASPGEMLSLPYPYPSYFCGIAPWHDYIQTWYDTSSPETIATLVAELKSAPPPWIVYQHDFKTMHLHEWAFTHDRPLPHRELERYISQQLASGEWALDFRSCFNKSDWMLIRTSPAETQLEQDLKMTFVQNPLHYCEE